MIGDPLQSSFDDVYWHLHTMWRCRAVAQVILLEPALGDALTELLVLTLCLELPQASAAQAELLSLSFTLSLPPSLSLSLSVCVCLVPGALISPTPVSNEHCDQQTLLFGPYFLRT